jgi:hypothetical protein
MLTNMSHSILSWRKYEKNLKVICINECNSDIILKIIKIVMDNNREIFFTMTRSADETTIIVDEDLDCFNEGYLYKEDYIGYILLNTNSFMEESGLLKKISAYFEQYQIPILYITTVNNNYLIIPKEYEEKMDAVSKYGIPL